MSNANGDSDLVKEIKYSNTPQTALSLASNTTEFGITALPGVIELAKAQRLKILALTGNAALGMTSTKSIMPDFYLNNGYMIALPPDTPMHIVQWYEKEFTKAIRHPDYQHWAKENHIHVDPNLVSNARVKSYFYSMKNRFKPIMQLLDQI
jgi:tripartite-type tricarboxylate transporter receptor subunit TctC